MALARNMLELVTILEKAVPSAKTSISDCIDHYVALGSINRLNDSETDSEAKLKEEIKARFFHWTQNVYKDLDIQRKDRLKQGKVAFTIALSSLVVGILLVFLGIFLIFAVSFSVGSATAISSIISNVVSVLAFRFNKEANDRVDNIVNELIILAKADVSMQYIYQISDAKKRDTAIKDLVRNIYTQANLSQNKDK